MGKIAFLEFDSHSKYDTSFFVKRIKFKTEEDKKEVEPLLGSTSVEIFSLLDKEIADIISNGVRIKTAEGLTYISKEYLEKIESITYFNEANLDMFLLTFEGSLCANDAVQQKEDLAFFRKDAHKILKIFKENMEREKFEELLCLFVLNGIELPENI